MPLRPPTTIQVGGSQISRRSHVAAVGAKNFEVYSEFELMGASVRAPPALSGSARDPQFTSFGGCGVIVANRINISKYHFRATSA